MSTPATTHQLPHRDTRARPPHTRAEKDAGPPSWIGPVAGTGGLLFVALLILQNAIRGSGPALAADPGEVAAYFADHRVAAVAPLVTFPLGMVAILCFAAGVCARAHATGAGRFWSFVGGSAVVVLAGLFGTVNLIEIAIAARVGRFAAESEVIAGLWTMHAAAFALNLAAIALALLALSRAALAAGLVPRALTWVTAAGAVCLFVPALGAVLVVEGSGLLYLGFAGFAVWGVFLVWTGLALLRGTGARA